MPGPQSFVPPRVTPSRPKQRFTVAQANKTLPLVGRVVKDIVQAHSRITALQARAQGGGKEKSALETQIHAAVERLQGYVDELTAIGVELKDFQSGLVDFIGRHQGRDIYLCWKLGEDKIAFWHELQSGFAGRQPVSLLSEGD
ncbi:MAG: DUF2203 domain-containing protein [Tepidisphaeraceae bacterium]